MRFRVTNFLEHVRASFWFIPAVMSVLAVALAAVTVTIDERIEAELRPGNLLIFGGTPAGARQLLGAIATSMVTVAGVVFSITILVLAQASSQFGPRLLRNFMRDTGTQIVLGTFTATFLYCLLVLRTVRGVDESEFVPQVSTTIAVILAISSVAVLIYFVHHVAGSINATNVIMSSNRELNSTLSRIFPGLIGHDPGEEESVGEEFLEKLKSESGEVPAIESGYLQVVHIRRLLDIATERDAVVDLVHHPGSFITEGSEIARVWPKERVTDTLTAEINGALAVGAHRRPTQDIEFAIDQMVEIAVRAISLGINDPFTAITCIDRLGAALSRLATMDFPSCYRFEGGKLRVLADPVEFPDLLDTAFNQIRQYGRGHVAVTIRLLEALSVIAGNTKRDEDREAIQRHAAMIESGSADLPEPQDRRNVQERYSRVLRALENVRETKAEG